MPYLSFQSLCIKKLMKSFITSYCGATFSNTSFTMLLCSVLPTLKYPVREVKTRFQERGRRWELSDREFKSTRSFHISKVSTHSFFTKRFSKIYFASHLPKFTSSFTFLSSFWFADVDVVSSTGSDDFFACCVRTSPSVLPSCKAADVTRTLALPRSLPP